MFDAETRKEWPDSPTWVIEGKLEDHLIASCPITTSMESMRRIHDQLEKEFNMPVCMVNHSMEFVVAKRLPSPEAAEILKRIDDYAEARREAFQKEALERTASEPTEPAESAELGDQSEETSMGGK
jgi:hypothetical protein